MTISKLSSFFAGLMGVAIAALPISPMASRRARAFGGLWSSQTSQNKHSGERIIFVDNPDSTVTAIIQVNYVGPSEKFAWIIPVPGKPTVGVSSNAVFERLEAATAPQYWMAVDVAGMCMREHRFEEAYEAEPGPDDVPTSADSASGPVLVTDRGSVGPYDYVTLALDPAASDPDSVVTDWLMTHGYHLTGLDSQVFGPYLREGFSLLAFRLTQHADVGAIRPVMLTYESQLPMIPIRPTAVSTQDDLGIQVWVFGPTQAVPDNYKSLVLNDALIDWSTSRKFAATALPAGGSGPFGPQVDKPGNYDALVTAAANEAGGQGFVTELGGPASQYRDKVWRSLDAEAFTAFSEASYADGIEAIYAAKPSYGHWDGWRDAIEGATTLPPALTLEEFGQDPSQYRGVVQVDAAKFLQLLHDKVVKPITDTTALFFKAPYLTRLYSTMSASEMTVDPVFNYNFELDQVSNVHVAKQFIQCSPTLQRPEDGPWYVNLPQGGVVVGEGARWPLPLGSLPNNLKVVALSTHGAGLVVQDNSPQIALKLFELAGTIGSDTSIPVPPRHGVRIGGPQRVSRPAGARLISGGAPTTSTPRHKAAPSDRGASDGSHCSISSVESADRGVLSGWLALTGLALTLRRRRARC